MSYFLDTNILVFYALGGENLDRDTTAIFSDYENLIYASSEVIKETIHLIRHKKIDVKHWKNPNDIWNSLSEWSFVIPCRPYYYCTSDYK
jgi:predicted nucleic acid-binding protein